MQKVDPLRNTCDLLIITSYKEMTTQIIVENINEKKPQAYHEQLSFEVLHFLVTIHSTFLPGYISFTLFLNIQVALIAANR